MISSLLNFEGGRLQSKMDDSTQQLDIPFSGIENEDLSKEKIVLSRGTVTVSDDGIFGLEFCNLKDKKLNLGEVATDRLIRYLCEARKKMPNLMQNPPLKDNCYHRWIVEEDKTNRLRLEAGVYSEKPYLTLRSYFSGELKPKDVEMAEGGSEAGVDAEGDEQLVAFQEAMKRRRQKLINAWKPTKNNFTFMPEEIGPFLNFVINKV